MADYLGDFAAGATVNLFWNTNAIAGESITRATDGSIRIYKNNSDTQRSSSAGITDTEDADSLTGVHRLTIDLNDNTDAGFYAAGNDYAVVLEGATIDGKVINHALGQFSIENRAVIGAAAIRSALGLASANLDTQLSTIDSVVDDILTDTGTTLQAELDGIQADTEDIQARLPAALVSGRMDSSIGAAAANTITASAFASDAVTEIQSGLATAAALATVDSVVDDILADTAVIGAAGAGLTAIPYNAAWDAEIQSEVTDALNAYDPPTNAEMVARTILAADYFTPSDYTAPDNAGIAALELDAAVIEAKIDTLGTVADGIKAQTDLFSFNAGAVDANIVQINDNATAAANLALSAGAMLAGTATAGTLSTTQMSTGLDTGLTLVNRTIIWTSGALRYSPAAITDFSGGVLTFSTQPAAPSEGDTFIIV